jgi:hypothetical protein
MAQVLVIGAGRGLGYEAVSATLRAGHSVRVLARSAASIRIQDTGLDKVSGDGPGRRYDPKRTPSHRRGYPDSRRPLLASGQLGWHNALVGIDARTARFHEGRRPEAPIAVTGRGAGDSRDRAPADRPLQLLPRRDRVKGLVGRRGPCN